MSGNIPTGHRVIRFNELIVGPAQASKYINSSSLMRGQFYGYRFYKHISKLFREEDLILDDNQPLFNDSASQEVSAADDAFF